MPVARPPGRPRDPANDRAILDTTLRLLVEQGYDAMSIEGVATAAGVGKTTIYRRYPGKRELVVAAISSIAVSLDEPPDTGDARRDLRELIERHFDVLSRDGLGFAMLGTLLAKERSEPALMELFQDVFIRPRQRMAERILERGKGHGQVRPDTSVEVVVQMISGAFTARHIVAGGAVDAAWLDEVLDTIWQGIGLDRDNAPADRMAPDPAGSR